MTEADNPAQCAGMNWEDIHPSVCEGCPLLAACTSERLDIDAELAADTRTITSHAKELRMDGVWGGKSLGQTSTDTLCDSCVGGAKAGGLCSRHYQRAIGRGDGSRSESAIVLPLSPKRRRLDEPTVAGYQRARKAGLEPTLAQHDAEAAYRKEQRS